MTVLHDTLAVSRVLVGRANEIEALHRFVERAKQGHGQTVLVAGDAGVGKSRLVAEAVMYAVSAGFVHLQGNCFSSDLAYPYGPFHDLLQTAGASQKRTQSPVSLQELTSLFAETMALEMPPDAEQQKRSFFRRLAQFFSDLSRQSPVVLVIEDIHWIDDTSIEFLYHFARQIVDQPVILFLTYRSDETSAHLRSWLAHFDRSHLAQKIILERLTYHEVSALLRAILTFDHTISAEFTNAIYALTDGNPFFIEEVLKALITTGEVFYHDGKWDRKPIDELRIPNTVQDAVQLRFAPLDDTAHFVLTLAAAIGRRFDFELLQTLTQLGEGELLDIVKKLIGTQLIIEEAGDRFAFRHALTRQAIYTGLLLRERRKLHQQIAQAIEQRIASPTRIADLAYHTYEAGDWTKALHYSVIAGEQALSLYAPQSAIEQFMRGEAAAHQLGIMPPMSLYRGRGLAYEAVGNFQQARTDLETAFSLAHEADDRRLEWQALIDLGMLWAGQDYTQTGHYYQRAFELAPQIDDPLALAHSLNRMGNWYLNVEHPINAHWHHQEALRIFERIGDKLGIAQTLDLLGMASYLGGNLAQGTDYYHRAISLFVELTHRRDLVSGLGTLTMRAPTYQTDTLNTLTNLTDAVKDGEAALQIARETGQRSDEVYSLIFLSMCLGANGNYQRALPMAQNALEIVNEIEHRQWLTASHFALGAIYLDILALESAQHYLERALNLARESGSLHWIHSSTGLLALAYLESNQLERAAAVLNQTKVVAPIRTLSQRLIARAQIELALRQGDAASALQVIDQLSTVGTQSDQSIRLLKLRGEALLALTQFADAENALQAALAMAASQAVQPLLWRINSLLARLYHTQKRYGHAEFHLKHAQDLIETLAANIPEQTLQNNFKQKADAQLPAIPKTRLGGLTSRERQVAELIAQGKSNHQIAEALVLGERTIETHVSNILSKLDFTSRAQIAAWVVEHLASHPG